MSLGVAVRDVRLEPLSPRDIERFLDAFGAALINRRSTTWRTLSGCDRQADPKALLAAHPAVMKRPVIEARGRLYLGWGAEVRAALSQE